MIGFGIFVFAIMVFLILYVFSSHTYSIEGNYFILRWRVLGIPFNRRRIALERISEVRPFNWQKDLFPGCDIWGTLFRGKGTIIILRSGVLRKVYVTPKDAEMLKGELEQALECQRC